MEDLQTTYKQLINFLDEYNPENLNDEQKHQKALDEIEKNGGLEYYVNIFNFELKDISPTARVKSPVKYFKKYEAAKIFQLASIIEAQNNDELYTVEALDFTPEEIQEMREKLAELVDEFPQYAI
jgi:hypothetical protein